MGNSLLKNHPCVDVQIYLLALTISDKHFVTTFLTKYNRDLQIFMKWFKAQNCFCATDCTLERKHFITAVCCNEYLLDSCLWLLAEAFDLLILRIMTHHFTLNVNSLCDPICLVC